MSVFKGTPGPWELIETLSHPHNKGEQISMIQTPLLAFDLVTVERHSYTRESFKSDSKLIAAAPILLTALQNLVHLHMCEQEGLASGQPSPTDWLKAVDEASEAIIKAIGGK